MTRRFSQTLNPEPWISLVASRVITILFFVTFVICGDHSTSAETMVCPLCPAIGARTIGEEIAESDVAMICELIEATGDDEPVATSFTDDELTEIADPPAKCRIVSFLKRHDDFVPDIQAVIEIPLDVAAEAGALFLVTGVDPPEPAWNSPTQLSKSAVEYVKSVGELGYDPIDRLEFYQRYLESADATIAQDAYDEFARAPYDDVIALKPKMDHELVVQRLQPDAVPSSRRRLFFMMLGICGDKGDLPLLEKMLRSDDPQMRLGMDALIACYMTLAGEQSLPLVQELFLTKKDAEYTDTYAAVMAIRFHGTEGRVLKPKQLSPMLRELLDRPRLADLVIPDLARWEDWSVLPQLVRMFKENDQDTSWVRVPIINYMKVCPLPQGKEALDELKQLDPDAFRRSNILFPFGDGDWDEDDSEDADSDDSDFKDNDAIDNTKVDS